MNHAANSLAKRCLEGTESPKAFMRRQMRNPAFKLRYVLAQHAKWLAYGSEGKRADLTDADLTDADLRGVDLRRANLTGVNLRNANLTGANLTNASLKGADLRGVNLKSANLWGKRGNDVLGGLAGDSARPCCGLSDGPRSGKEITINA